MAAPKLIASFFARPGTSLGLMLSVDADPAAADSVAAELFEAVDVEGDVESAGATPAGAGLDATSPALTPARGASATQAVRAARARTARRKERTEDM